MFLKRKEKNKNEIYKCVKSKIKWTNAPFFFEYVRLAKHKINLTRPY